MRVSDVADLTYSARNFADSSQMHLDEHGNEKTPLLSGDL